MDFIQQFLDAMVAAGCAPNGEMIVADDKRHRIRIDGDKGLTRTGSYQLRIDGDFAVGWFRNFREGVTHKWSSRASKTFTPDEKAAWRERIDAVMSKRAAEIKETQKQASARAAAIWEKASKTGESEYLKRKGVALNGARIYRGMVVVSVKVGDKLTALQFIAPSGDKRFLSGSELVGGYFSIAKKGDDLTRMTICEGFATGCSVREATGSVVVVAFNAGNLVPVAKALRKKYPDVQITIAADNDAWTKKPDGTPWNPGIDFARQAAVAIGGARVVWPEFEEQHLDARPTDFNDALLLYGVQYVKERLTTPIADEIPAETQEEAPTEFLEPPVPDLHLGGGEILPPPRQHGDFGMRFRVLGYNGGMFYYFPFQARQIVALSAAGHSIQNLLQLDTLSAWENTFGGEKISHAKVAVFAANAMMALARKRGVYQQEDRVRGAGVWIDNGTIVFHCGDALYVEGRRTAFEDFEGSYTYVATTRLMAPADVALDSYEAHRLRKICEAVSWENPLSGSLLAGWLVIAPVCAALVYRPHIFITGEAESGKSTVLNRIIKPVLGLMGLNVDGKTTEPSIRQRMGYAGRPLIFDEAEPSGNMEAVLDLARLASTGGVVSKFGQPAFNARFAACLSAINSSISKTADESRITFMVIKKNRARTAMQDYDDLLAMIEETITDDFSARLIARTLDNMDALITNIRVFERAARRSLSPRASQQIGTMLAGLYLLSRTDKITEDAAIAWISQHDWSEHAHSEDISDPLKLVQYIAGALIRYSSGTQEISIGDLVTKVHVDRDHNSDKVLRYHGIVVRDGRVFIASRSQNLARILRETEWKVKWSRTLSDVPGAEKEKIVYFSAGIKTSAVSLPIELFLQGETLHEVL